MKKIFIVILSIVCLFQSNIIAEELIHSVRVIDGYEEVISKKNQSTILVFSADWCKYCNKLKSEVKNLDLGQYDIHFIDVESRPDLKKEYSVKSLPTSIILKNKKEISRKIGYEKKEYQNWIDSNKEVNNG